MKQQGAQIDTATAIKLRRQMDEKLVETLTKQLKQKTKLQGLLKLRAETELKIQNGKVARFVLYNVFVLYSCMTFPIQTHYGDYIKDCLSSSTTSPPSSLAPTTSTPLTTHPLLQSLSVTSTPIHTSRSVPDYAGSSTPSSNPPEVPQHDITRPGQVITLYEGIDGPLPDNEYNGYEIYTDDNGNSYALDPCPVDKVG